MAMLGEVQSALAHCKQALALTRELELRSEQGWALQIMGSILYDLGRFDEAAERFRQALAIRQELAETREAIGTLAGLGSAYLGLGDLPQAVECVEAILVHISRNGVEGFEGPVKVFLSCYQILSAAQDPRAADIIRQGHALLLEAAAKIETEAMRRSYLERVPENRAMAAAYEKAGRP
jgi:tetratricopeptide (TPR) repeat protein